MPDILAVPAFKVVKYDGANASEVLDALNAVSAVVAELVEESAGVLTVQVATYGGARQGGGDFEFVLQTGDWIRPSGPEVIAAEQFAQLWIVK
jgi:hypothetical protein